MTATIDPLTPALTWTQNRFQGQQVTWTMRSFTTRLLTATASHVHRTKAIANSHVWCAQSDVHTVNCYSNSHYENYVLNFRSVLAYSLHVHCVCELNPR